MTSLLTRLIRLPRDWRKLAGVVCLAVGALLLLGQIGHLSWMPYLAFFLVGLVLFIWGLEMKNSVGQISGCLMVGAGSGMFFGFGRASSTLAVFVQIGIALCGLGVGFCLITVVRYLSDAKFRWWPLFPGLVIGSVGLCLASSAGRFIDFVLYISVGLGLALLCFGIVRRWIGLIIPGCIFLGSGPGVYVAWGANLAPNPVARTGLMLVCIAFGWILITVFSRAIHDGFTWWPLIPGGVIEMVGWGLYIGGNPSNAISFIGNTGSVGLIVMGIYLLLMRRGIRK